MTTKRRTRQTRAQREEAHREAVERHKERIRESMEGGQHIYGEEHFREATRNGDYARADALEELMPEIRRHNKRVEGGTKA